MIPVAADRRQPLLVVGHSLRSQPPFQIVEAASGTCEILWLIDESVPENAVTSRLLRKVGTVVNLAGLSLEDTVSVLRERSPDGIVAYSEEDIVLLSSIAEELGLDYHTPEVAQRLVDKLTQREALRAGGVPTPLCWQVPADRDPAAVEAVAAAVEFPAVLKPRFGSGSQYMTLVADAGDLVRQLAVLPPQAGGETGMLVEQYLPSLATGPSEWFGDYVSVESLVAAGEISHVAVTGRFPLAEPFRETGAFIPANLSPAQLAAVLEVATAALRALGVRTGGFHTEIKLTPDGPRVIEVNGRLGGGIPEMLFQASGVSLFDLSIRAALGERVVVDGPVPCTRVGWRFLFQPPTSARRVVSIEGLDRLAELAGVNAIFVNRSPGDTVDWREGTGHYIYEVTGVSADYDGWLEVDRFLNEQVSIVCD
ncbi:MAG: ATP-grasp domain-containing protein [Acidimicrobiales bacterium]